MHLCQYVKRALMCLVLSTLSFSLLAAPPVRDKPQVKSANERDKVVMEVISPIQKSEESFKFSVSVEQLNCHARCKITSSIDEKTQLQLDGGLTGEASRLQSGKQYPVNWVQFDDSGNHRISALSLSLEQL